MSFHANARSRRDWSGVSDHSRTNRILARLFREVLFRLPLKEDRHRNRRPDVAFVSFDRWSKGKSESYRENAWDVVPDLAVEVVSPNDFADELIRKVSEYFAAGVRLVWVVYPRQKLVYVYDSFLSIHIIGHDRGSLDGGSVLPGLSLPLSDVFIGEATEEPGAK